MAKKKTLSQRERRALRLQQVFFALLGVLVILSMIISLIR